MLSRRSNPLISVAFLLVAMSSVQIGAAIAKRTFDVVGPIGAVALRALFAALVLGVIVRPWRARRTRESWRSVIIYGVSIGAMNILFYSALRTVPLGIATAIEFTGPLVVAVLGSRRGVDFLWIALAAGGLVALLPVGGATSGIDPVGAAFALGAGACWGLYIVVGRTAGAEHGLQTTAIGLAIAAVIVLPFGLAEAGLSMFTPRVLPLAFAVAILSSALPYTLEMFALPRLPTKTFGTLMSAEPAFGALAGLTLLGEHLSARQWLAITAIITASIGTTLGASQGLAPQGTDPTVGDLGNEGVRE